MEANQSKSHQMKRAGKNVEHQESKCQRLESSAESMMKVTKIIDLNDDCLVKIFGRLDLQSLLNVAIANGWLRPAAGDVYKREYGTKSVEIKGCDDYRPNTSANERYIREMEFHPLKERDNRIEIHGLRRCLPYLRCFGSSITSLEIDYKKSRSKRYGYVHQQINDYCAESLTHILFSDMPNIAVKQFQKTFINVQSVQISNSNLREQLSSFSKCFPNTRRLHLGHVSMENCSAIRFEHLKELSIDGCDATGLRTKVADFLRMNRQLGSLKVDVLNNYPPSANDLLDAIKHNESLTKLTVNSCFSASHEMDSAAVQRLASEHSELVEISLRDYQFKVDDVVALIRHFNSLKHFRFRIDPSEWFRLVSSLENSEWRVRRRVFQQYTVVTLIRS